MIGRGMIGAGTTRNYWNPADKNASLVLSNRNLTATASAGGTYEAARAIHSRSAGKWYFEFVYTDAGGSSDAAVGIGKAAATLSGSVGSDANAYGFGHVVNGLMNGGVAAATPGAIGNGDLGQVAVDFGNLKIWVRLNSGNWNGVGSDNPATNTGGVSITSGTYFPMVACRSQGSILTRFQRPSFVNPVPAGFSAWI